MSPCGWSRLAFAGLLDRAEEPHQATHPALESFAATATPAPAATRAAAPCSTSRLGSFASALTAGAASALAVEHAAVDRELLVLLGELDQHLGHRDRIRRSRRPGRSALAAALRAARNAVSFMAAARACSWRPCTRRRLACSARRSLLQLAPTRQAAMRGDQRARSRARSARCSSATTAVFSSRFTAALLTPPRRADGERIDLDARAHGRRDRHALQVVALGRGRLRPHEAASAARWRCRSASAAPNDALPIGTWTMPAFSTRYSTLPALSFADGLADVERDGADLRVRHEAARTEHLADAADERPSCRASRSRLSKSSQFSSWIFLTSSSPPTKSAPALVASRSFSPLANDQHAHATYRCRAAARRCRARSGRPAADRRRAGRRSRPSRRTSPSPVSTASAIASSSG